MRPIYGDDTAAENLQKAVDCFLLSGALKLYREAHDVDINCRHHTMLVHTSQRVQDHQEMAAAINELFENGGYFDGRAEARLSTLLSTDFRPVSDARSPDLPFPTDYADCRPFIERCVERLESGPEGSSS